ncbi:DUF488 domain-containing protein [bacterium]|nr:DUF488 domain-containing protein [bacterium]
MQTKRVYEPTTDDDGFRVLVDRLWPRGVSKEKARVDVWMRDVAPSNELRKWFGHDPARWDEFRARYRKEIGDSEALAELKKIVKAHKKVTLLFSAKEEEHNNAIALAGILEKKN